MAAVPLDVPHPESATLKGNRLLPLRLRGTHEALIFLRLIHTRRDQGGVARVVAENHGARRFARVPQGVDEGDDLGYIIRELLDSLIAAVDWTAVLMD